MEQTGYPIQFSVEYPDRPLDRVTTAFRIFVAIPILIVLGAVYGGQPILLIAAIGVVGGLVMAVTLAATSGWALVRLLRSVRSPGRTGAGV